MVQLYLTFFFYYLTFFLFVILMTILWLCRLSPPRGVQVSSRPIRRDQVGVCASGKGADEEHDKGGGKEEDSCGSNEKESNDNCQKKEAEGELTRLYVCEMKCTARQSIALSS